MQNDKDYIKNKFERLKDQKDEVTKEIQELVVFAERMGYRLNAITGEVKEIDNKHWNKFKDV